MDAEIRHQSRPLRRAGPLLLAVGLVLAYGVLTALHAGNSQGWSDFAVSGELLAYTLATIGCAIRVRRERTRLSGARATHEGSAEEASATALQRQTWLAWWMLAAGMAAWSIGELYIAVYEVGLQLAVPEPSPADPAFILGYGFIICGLLAFVRTPAGRLSHLRGAVEGLFIASGFLLSSWSLVIGSVLVHSGTLSFAGLVHLAYPVLDALVLAGVFFVFLRRREDLPAGLGLLALGIVVVAVSDSAWWYMGEVDASLPRVSPVQTGWIAGLLLIALAGLGRGAQRRRRGEAGRRYALILPSLPAVLGALIVLGRWLLGARVESGGVLLEIVTIALLLGVVLLVIATYENHALLSDLEGRVEGRTAELQERTEELQRTERYYRALVQNSSDIVMVVGADLRISYASESIETIFGFEPDQLVGEHLDVFGVIAVDGLSEVLDRVALNPDQVARVEWKLIDRTGRVRCAESTASNLLADPHVRGVVLNTRDDTDRAALSDQLRDQAFRDPLTGLANRALLSDRASQAFARAERTGAEVAVIAIDLDAFKLVNDGYGHKAGDELLCTVAQRLQLALRPEDTVARLGGDEFVVLVDSAPQDVDVIALAERIRDAIRGEVMIEGSGHRISASIGVAVGRPPLTNFDQLLCDADLALYDVKRTGRNGVRLFESGMHQDARERFKLQADLRRAIENSELCLRYQPEFDAAGEVLEGFEALVRWQHPERGLLAPDAFIPLAEETGLVVPLGRWVLGEALRQTVAWTRQHPASQPLSISVNVSAVQLSNPSVIADVRSALAQSGIEPGRVVLELTESAFIDMTPSVLETLDALKQLGVRLAIDDFGTGYASVSVLQGMPIDILKIDRSFIASIDDGARGNDLLEAIVNIGRVLSLVTIAEGIEQASQLEATRAVGCDLAQGYLLGRPLPPEDALRMILERTASTSESVAAVGPQRPPGRAITRR